MDCVANGCERLHTEVFRTDDMANRTAIADQFFGLMPAVRDNGDSNDDDEIEVE